MGCQNVDEGGGQEHSNAGQEGQHKAPEVAALPQRARHLLLILCIIHRFRAAALLVLHMQPTPLLLRMASENQRFYDSNPSTSHAL